jgi:hypothetical protein
MRAYPQSEQRRMPARTAWLLEIGRRLRAEYTAVQEPVPERLAALIKQLEEVNTNPATQEDVSEALEDVDHAYR